jgi:hypothetical protein
MPCKRASLSLGALLGNLEGVRFPGLLREKYVWVPVLDPEAIKISSLGAIWNLVKEQSSSELILDCGVQRACL